MTADSSFVCAQCGEDHAGFPKDQGYMLPDDVWATPEGEREKHADWSTDLCSMGDRFFLRALLEVPFTGSDDYFGWGVWVEVAGPVFQRYVEIYEKDGSNEPTAVGILANQIPTYEDAYGEMVTITFGSPDARPTLRLNPDSRSSLAVDQREGMDQARYHDILAAIGAL